ncbi:hypothetical protein J19TS2_15890 [Cohnella xylanilytica]|nr:hypothetical protein J19TS2_15890 [Cohnella xylanilytica]
MARGLRYPVQFHVVADRLDDSLPRLEQRLFLFRGQILATFHPFVHLTFVMYIAIVKNKPDKVKKVRKLK